MYPLSIDMSRLLVIALSTALLAACATPAPVEESQVQPTPELPEPPPVVVRPIPADSVYPLLLAEFSLRRRAYDTALDTYMEQRGIPQFLQGIREGVERATQIVADMLTYSRRSSSSFEPTSLVELVETSLRLASHDYDLKKDYDFRRVQVVRDIQLASDQLQCDRVAIEQVLLNLVKNAAQAMRFVDEESNPGDQISVGQVVYEGAWKTRHAGLSVLLQTFNQRTGVPVTFGHKELRLTDPAIFNAPLLYLTGHEYFTFSEKEQANLRQYLQNGGFLFAEACCGRKGFDLAFRQAMKGVLTF